MNGRWTSNLLKRIGLMLVLFAAPALAVEDQRFLEQVTSQTRAGFERSSSPARAARSRVRATASAPAPGREALEDRRSNWSSDCWPTAI